MVAHKEAVLNRVMNMSSHFHCPSRAQHRESQQNYPSPRLSLRGFTCILDEPEGLASNISTHLEAGCDLPGNWGISRHLLHLLPQSHSNNKTRSVLSPWKCWYPGLVPQLSVAAACGDRPRLLTLIAHRAYIHKSHRAIANKEAILKQMQKQPSPLPPQAVHQAQNRGNRQDSPSPSSP